MRRALVFIVVLGSGVAVADETTQTEVVAPEKCASCTARHKSLQALQKARVPAEKDVSEPRETEPDE